MTTGNVVFDYEVTGSAATSIDTGAILDGDVDGWYTVIIRRIGNTATDHCGIRINSDSGNNYGRRGIYASTTTVANFSTSPTSYIYGSSDGANNTGFSIHTIYAKSGSVRLSNMSGIDNANGTTIAYLENIGSVWNNTVDNITSLQFVSIGSSKLGVGTRVIILKGNALAVGTSPGTTGAWKRVGSTVLTGAASSVTFNSGVAGDTAVLFYLSHQIKAASATGDIKINFNNDTGNNYGYQRLTATNTTVAAARATPSCFYGGVTSTNAYFSTGFTLMFAKQGFLRPAITQTINDITGTTVTAIWTLGQSYNVTNTNITEIDIATTTNNFDTGSQFDLYALYV
jgi:hypothetical protein